jgi:hypothetical protein
MKNTPEIDAILSELTAICIDAVNGDTATSSPRIDALVDSLATNGWERKQHEREPLSVVLRKRVDTSPSSEPIQPHGELLEGVLTQIQKSYDHAIRFRTAVPEEMKSPAASKRAQTLPPHTAIHDNRGTS